MRYQFFTNTPAHVHLYKHVIDELSEDGHAVSVLARDYGCTTDLLEHHDIDHTVYGPCGTTKWSLLGRLPQHYTHIIRHSREFDPDMVFGMGAYAAHTGALTRTPTVLVLDSEPTGLDHTVSMPFAETIVTPGAFRKDLGEKHYTFEGFKECAYLHPAVYEPAVDVHELLELDADERFGVVRFNAFGSHHDVGHAGFGRDERRALIKRLAEDLTVFVSDEGNDIDIDRLPARPYVAPPGALHDVLNEATLLVADTQTMVTEAALLGTPAIRSNSFVGANDMGNFIELEANELVYNHESFADVLETVDQLLSTPNLESLWNRRRDAYVNELENLTQIITELARSRGNTHSVAALEPRGNSSGRPARESRPSTPSQ